MRHFPDPRAPPPPLVSPDEMVRSDLCIGCGACVADQPGARIEWDRDGHLKPVGPSGWYRQKQERIATRCPFSPAAANEDFIAERRFATAQNQDRRIGRFEAAYVGHVLEASYRSEASSGGMASWVAAELLRTGQVDGVAHVWPADPGRTGRFFEYRISRSPEEVQRGAKSRYYPVELSGVIREIRAVPGRYAIIGIPCFIKAIHLLRCADPVIAERVTHTLGIFCGHMKSARLIESFAWQLGAELEAVQAVDYRRKDPGRPANWYRAHLDLTDAGAAEEDWWHLADGDWGAGFLQNPACDFCDDVVAETADISFGDAWVEPYSSDGRGTNVVIARTPELKAMLEQAIASERLELRPVDADFVAATQDAGLRHRRQGLAYRLTWSRRGLSPRKRVAPSAQGIELRRRLVYRMRSAISRWSHRMFRLARVFRAPWIYIGWARLMLRLYQALTYSRGRLGRVIDSAERLLSRPSD